ncbi:MAG: aminotransferase class I/II-fold pyridoxal phosphate-dependent enzyme [Mycetocola sp.]
MSGEPRSFLDVSAAPGQEEVDRTRARLVDFSHGDVDAFPPVPGAGEAIAAAINRGGSAAYSPYRGHREVRTHAAARIAEFTGVPVDPDSEIIITPGTQTALYLTLAASLSPGDAVAIIEPDYFANRRIPLSLGAVPHPVRLEYPDDAESSIRFDELDAALAAGARVVVLSNPNNPTGVVYSAEVLGAVVERAEAADALLVVDELYSRLVYDDRPFTHMRALPLAAGRCVTLLGPSKTESLSGFRVGAAVGPAPVIARMEQLLGIVSLRTAGYNQSVLDTWFEEPEGWLAQRTLQHREIRDGLVARFRVVPGLRVRATEGGSYLFVRPPRLTVSVDELVRIAREDEDVVVTRGAEFGPGVADGFRLNFSQDRERAFAAVDRLVALMSTKLPGAES